jgi:galactose mutarotase-like enzyme
LISLKSSQGKEYIWEEILNFGKTFSSFISIVGTLKNNTFHHNEKNYTCLGMDLLEMEFQLIDSTENSATFSIQSSEETLKVYPFEFELHLIYTLEK